MKLGSPDLSQTLTITAAQQYLGHVKIEFAREGERYRASYYQLVNTVEQCSLAVGKVQTAMLIFWETPALIE